MAGNRADQYIDAGADRDSGPVQNKQRQPKPAAQWYEGFSRSLAHHLKPQGCDRRLLRQLLGGAWCAVSSLPDCDCGDRSRFLFLNGVPRSKEMSDRFLDIGVDSFSMHFLTRLIEDNY
jgi:hypothetical protein